jgi:hypothetical protein
MHTSVEAERGHMQRLDSCSKPQVFLVSLVVRQSDEKTLVMQAPQASVQFFSPVVVVGPASVGV